MKINDYEFNENSQELDVTESEEFLPDLTTLLISPEEPVKKTPKGKVDARREVEEILLEKRYKEIYGDPFDDTGTCTSRA